MPVRSSPSPTSSTTQSPLTLPMAAGGSRLPPRLTTLAVFSSPTPNPFSPNRRVARPRPRLPPISISMDPALVDPAHLQALMLSCAHSCAIRLSAPDAAARPEPVDIRKLRTAVAHSFLVVSVFCGARFLEDDDGGDDRRFLGLELDLGLGRRGEQRLVGFGRAVSDVGLTASVHDVVVHPSLQRRGIGRKILEKITRPFFETCGFGDDAMGSTTMMYTRSMKQ